MAFALTTFWFCLIAALMAFSGPVGKQGTAFGLLYILAFGLLWAMVRTFPSGLSARRAFWTIFGLGVGLRGLFLVFPPSLDVNRYVWEGYLQLQGLNPYVFAPQDPRLQPLASGSLRAVFDGINHKDLAACYPPLAQLLFRALAALRADPFFFKLMAALADAAVLLPLAALLKREGLPPVRLLWYAANPLLLVFIAGEGHLDSLMVLPLCLGVALVAAGRARSGFFCLGCAAMVKYLAALAVPFLITRHNRRQSLWALIPCLAFLPFADAGRDLFGSLAVFGASMHYNDFLPAVLRPLLGPAGSLIVVAGLLAAGLALIFLTVPERTRSLLYAFGWLLLCMPTLHPWYLSVVAPFAALLAAPAWLFLQAAVAVTFPVLAVEYATGVFQEIHWLKWLQYGTFVLLLVWPHFRPWGRRQPRREPLKTLSVVIPTLDEGRHLAACLDALAGAPEVCEVIVADGGSSDNTVALARQGAARVVTAARGRGLQIAAGVAHARGDVVLVVHADCRLAPGIASRILDALNRDRTLVGGAMAMTFDRSRPATRVVVGLNNWRTRLTGIAFGDQGQFFVRAVLPAIGGFPELMLMEDVELALRLKGAGRLVFLRNGLKASSRRWAQGPFGPQVWMVLRLCAGYLLQRRVGDVGHAARRYYRLYYRS
ncbi:MAG: TIGR04283 family arsenosugar biosynthesis glycosyltransferase [Desulfobacterales bacterium]